MGKATVKSIGILLAVLALLNANPLCAKEINVRPGKGTLVKALFDAAEGDVLKLKPGKYLGSISVPTGVTILGDEKKGARIIGNVTPAVSLDGQRIVLKHLLVVGSGRVTIGLSGGLHSARVEHCRFEKLKTGVSLMGAPLCDFMGCTFSQCKVAISAQGEASPTIWGCLFMGGEKGVVSSLGAPYIRNCLFAGQLTAVLVANPKCPLSIRNNVFFKCADLAIYAKSDLFGPNIKNNIFHACKRGVVCTTTMGTVSHNVVSAMKADSFGGSDGKPYLDQGSLCNAEEQLKISVTSKGTVKMSDSIALLKGVHDPWEPKGTAKRIGFDRKSFQPGHLGQLKEAPPARFTSPYVVNGICEEYLCLRMWGFTRSDRQAVGKENGKQIDFLYVMENGKLVAKRFDIHRFFGE